MNIETYNEIITLFGVFVVSIIIGQAIYYFFTKRLGLRKFEIEMTVKGFNDIAKELNRIRTSENGVSDGDSIEMNGADNSDSFTIEIVKKV